MNRLLSILARRSVSFGIAAALCVLGIVLLVLGWPEGDRLQKALLQLSGLSLSLAVGAVLGWFVASRTVWERPGFRYVRWVMLGCLGLGLVLYLVAVATQRGGLTPLAQFFIWLAFGVVAIYFMIRGVDRAAATVERPALVELLEGEHAIEGPVLTSPLPSLLQHDDETDAEPQPRRAIE